MSGILRIAAERQRQIDEEKWSAAHDDKHRQGELARAAACYALTPIIREQMLLKRSLASHLWPFEWRNWKPLTPHSTADVRRQARIRELEKAGALIAAEIDRLERLS